MGSKLRVGLLTYGLDRPLTGVTRVALELGMALNRNEECEVVYLTPYQSGPFRHQDNYRSWYLPGCAKLPALMLWGGPLIALAARRLQVDVVHDPIGISPFTLGRWAGAFKRVVTIHDAIAFRYAEGYPWLNNVLHKRYVPATLGHVDAVITVSKHAQQDLMQFLDLAGKSTHVVHNGVNGRFQPLPEASTKSVARLYGLTEPYILSVGAQQARKNLDRLLAAFARLHTVMPEYRLAIVGPTIWGHDGLREKVMALGLENVIKTLGYVPDEHLPALYSMASLFVFPSLYEGFGLPVLEAMACGTTVVCSDIPSHREVAGDAAVLVDPTNIEGMADGMRRVLSQPKLRAEMRESGLVRARGFSWEQAAKETIAVYRQVLAD